MNPKNKIQKVLYNSNMEYRKMMDSLARDEALLNAINQADARYEKDHDLAAVIAAYEQAFIVADPPCSSSKCFNLADFYVQNGEKQKAINFLRTIIKKWPERKARAESKIAKISK